MSDEELRHLSPAEVVAQVRRLEARIAELEGELARRGGSPKTPQNSSTPPSKGWQRNRPAPEGAKLGPPFGHLGASRRRVEPNAVVLCQPTQCASAACGAAPPGSARGAAHSGWRTGSSLGAPDPAPIAGPTRTGPQGVSIEVEFCQDLLTKPAQWLYWAQR